MKTFFSWFSGAEVSVCGTFDPRADIAPAGILVLVQPQRRLRMRPIRGEADGTNQTNMLFWFLQAVGLVFRYWRQCHADPSIWCAQQVHVHTPVRALAVCPLSVVSAAYEMVTSKTNLSLFFFFIKLCLAVKHVFI